MLFQPGRALLRVVMWAQSANTSVFLRRMELEADRYQVRVAGSESVRLHGARTQPAGNGSPADRRRAEPFVEAG